MAKHLVDIDENALRSARAELGTRLRHAPIRQVIEPLAASGSLACAGITDLEIGHAARDGREWDQAVDALDAFELIATRGQASARPKGVRSADRGRRRIAAPADRVWAVVSHPEGHVQIDGSGMIEATLDARSLVAVGDTFDMAMDREPLGDVPLGKYQVRNWVTQIEVGRLIEWGTNLLGKDEPVGSRWGWKIEPVTPTECDVTNDTDWSFLPEDYQSHWPIVPVSMFERSIENLERIVTS